MGRSERWLARATATSAIHTLDTPFGRAPFYWYETQFWYCSGDSSLSGHIVVVVCCAHPPPQSPSLSAQQQLTRLAQHDLHRMLGTFSIYPSTPRLTLHVNSLSRRAYSEHDATPAAYGHQSRALSAPYRAHHTGAFPLGLVHPLGPLPHDAERIRALVRRVRSELMCRRRYLIMRTLRLFVADGGTNSHHDARVGLLADARTRRAASSRNGKSETTPARYDDVTRARRTPSVAQSVLPKTWSDAVSAPDLVREDAGIDLVLACMVHKTRCVILGTTSLFRHSRARTSSQPARRLCDWKSAWTLAGTLGSLDADGSSTAQCRMQCQRAHEPRIRWCDVRGPLTSLRREQTIHSSSPSAPSASCADWSRDGPIVARTYYAQERSLRYVVTGNAYTATVITISNSETAAVHTVRVVLADRMRQRRCSRIAACAVWAGVRRVR